MAIPLSVFIIAKNEEDRIWRTINSVVDWVDEVIVIDSGSTDDTVGLSERLGARVVFNEWPGYGQQKILGENLSRNDWVFNLDADEEVTPQLRKSIEELFEGGKQPEKNAYKMTRKLILFNDKKPYPGCPREHLFRVYNKHKAGFRDSTVHDMVVVREGPTGRVKGTLNHRTFRSLAHMQKKLDFYTGMQAKDLFMKGRMPSGLRLFSETVFPFWKNYILRRYALFGLNGYLISQLYAQNRLSRSIKALDEFQKYGEQAELEKPEGVLRIAHLLVGSQNGGAEEFFVRMTVGLAERGVKQHVFMSPHKFREKVFSDAGITFTLLNFDNILKDRQARKRIKNLTKLFSPHIFLAHMSRAARRTPRGDFVRMTRMGGYYDLRHYRGFDHVITISPKIGQHTVDSGWNISKTSQIVHFTDTHPESAKMIPKTDLDTPADATVLLTLCRVSPVKGLDTLINALARLPSHIHLWIAGEGPEEDNLKNLAISLNISDRIHFLGWRTDRADLLKSCDIFVHAARMEPLGAIIPEAWEAGKPIVTTASDGPAWMCTNEENALVVPVDDVESLANAIARVDTQADLARRLAENGKKTHAEKHSKNVIIQQYINVFKEQVHAKFPEIAIEDLKP